MCGRYTLRKPGLLKKQVFQTDFEEFSELKIEPRWNVAPSQMVPVIKYDRKQERIVPTMARWGFVPSWERGKPKFRPSNARDDKVLKSGMYKQSFDRRRCLVPADGFYEWLVLDPKRKQPFFFHFSDNRPWAFAGFYDVWHDDEKDETADRMTFITVALTGCWNLSMIACQSCSHPRPTSSGGLTQKFGARTYSIF